MCLCEEIEEEIAQRFPDADWNMDEACDALNEWLGEPCEYTDYDEEDEEEYGCTCPICGRVICNWCE